MHLLYDSEGFLALVMLGGGLVFRRKKRDIVEQLANLTDLSPTTLYKLKNGDSSSEEGFKKLNFNLSDQTVN